MRDAIQIFGLILLFVLLAVQYPFVDVDAAEDGADAAGFASFITLSPSAHAAYIDAARTSWQVSNAARGTPSVGRLDSDVPLLSDTLPPLSRPNLAVPAPAGPPIPPPDPDTYSLVPGTMGRDLPVFSARPSPAEDRRKADGAAAKAAFGRAEMLSTDNSKTLKEIMQ